LDSLVKDDGTKVKYTYDAAGQRISKRVNDTTEVYVRDASGNVMSVYVQSGKGDNIPLKQTEIHVYGSSLLGIYKPTDEKIDTILLPNGKIAIRSSYKRGGMEYYLSSQNGNTLAIVSDKRLPVDSNNDGKIDYYLPDMVSATYYSTYGATAYSFNGDSLKLAFNGQRRSSEISKTAQTALYWEYDGDVGKRWNVDPLSVKFPWQAPYCGLDGNPISKSDPSGAATNDFVKNNKTGKIRWDNKAKSQKTTKSGETYIGKTLTLNFNSYIDKKLWDGPLWNFPAGDKLTTKITLTGNDNKDGKLISVTATEEVVVGSTPFGKARPYYPGLGSNQNIFSGNSSKGEININMEQHASVSPFEEFGMKAMGYNIVNVAQKLEINISAKGVLTVTSYTDVFPSATLTLNGNFIMRYNQPSFVNTHTLPVLDITPPYSEQMPIAVRDYSYLPTMFYRR